MFLLTKKANLANFADDKTVYAASKDITSLLEISKSELEKAINWFETNHMFANRKKFQATVAYHNKNINDNYTLKK